MIMAKYDVKTNDPDASYFYVFKVNGNYAAIFHNSDRLYDFLFASLHRNPILKRRLL